MPEFCLFMQKVKHGDSVGKTSSKVENNRVIRRLKLNI